MCLVRSGSSAKAGGAVSIFVMVLPVEPYVRFIFRALYYNNGRRPIARDGGPLNFVVFFVVFKHRSYASMILFK